MSKFQMTVVCGRILLFLLLFSLSFFLVMFFRKLRPVDRVRKKLDELDRKRLMETGFMKKGYVEGRLDRLDEELTQAGVKRFIPKAAVEIWFLVNVLEFSLIFCFMDEGILIPLLTAALAVYVNKMSLDMLRYRNNRIIEKHMLQFMNLVSDYSISEGEITSIFYKAGQSMPNPLRRLLINCHLTARSSGDSEAALYELRRSVDHILFKKLLLLLELCSKSTGDYQIAVGKCRELVNTYLQEEKEKAGIVRGLIGEVLIMSAVAAYGIFVMLTDFSEGMLAEGSMAEFFFQNPAGQAGLIMYTALMLCMVRIITKFAKER